MNLIEHKRQECSIWFEQKLAVGVEKARKMTQKIPKQIDMSLYISVPDFFVKQADINHKKMRERKGTTCWRYQTN